MAGGLADFTNLLRYETFAVAYYGGMSYAPGRLALPVRHRLRLRRMAGGLGWRASLHLRQTQQSLKLGMNFFDI
jgi:hypothetical protein